MTTTRALIAGLGVIGLTALAGACNPYNPDLGDQPFRCGTSVPECPDGYACVFYSDTQRFCEREGSNPDAPPDAGNDEPDATAFLCNNDLEIEPNGELTNATPTPIPQQRPDYELVGLAICPTTDIDMFHFRIDQAGKGIQAELTFNIEFGALVLEIANSSGQMIASGVAVGGDPGFVRAEIQNAASGVHYVRVQATPGIENNYSVRIVTTDP